MSTVNKKDLMNEVYDSLLISTGIVGISIAINKIIGDGKSVPSLTYLAKITASQTLVWMASTMLVKWTQDKKYLTVDSFEM